MQIPTQFRTDFNLSDQICNALGFYLEKLKIWNHTHRLIGSRDNETLLYRHVADSLSLLPYIQKSVHYNQPYHIADLGSGAGFPAIPLAIATKSMGDFVQFDLIEKKYKKNAFLREMIRYLHLTHTTLYPMPITTYFSQYVKNKPPNILTARALAPLNTLLFMTYPYLSPPTKAVFFKGQNVDRELTHAQKYWTIQYEIKKSQKYPGVLLIIEKAVPNQPIDTIVIKKRRK